MHSSTPAPKSFVWYRAIGNRYQITTRDGITRTGICIAATAAGEMTLRDDDGYEFGITVGERWFTVTKLEQRSTPVHITHRELKHRHWDGWEVTDHEWRMANTPADFVLPAVAGLQVAA